MSGCCSAVSAAGFDEGSGGVGDERPALANVGIERLGRQLEIPRASSGCAGLIGRASTRARCDQPGRYWAPGRRQCGRRGLSRAGVNAVAGAVSLCSICRPNSVTPPYTSSVIAATGAAIANLIAALHITCGLIGRTVRALNPQQGCTPVLIVRV